MQATYFQMVQGRGQLYVLHWPLVQSLPPADRRDTDERFGSQDFSAEILRCSSAPRPSPAVGKGCQAIRVVLTMQPVSPEFGDRCLTSSWKV